MSLLRDWLAPPGPAVVEVDGRERRLLLTEILVVATVTLGLSGLRSLISLLDSLAAPAPLASRQVSIDRPLATDAWVDLAAQLASSLQLVAWGALGLYLLVRAGSGPRAVGLDGTRPGRDALAGLGLAAVIGIPGLGFYLLTRALGINLTVVPSLLDDHWWRVPVLVLSAVANAWAEEVLVVGWLLSTLRRLGLSENRSLAVSALLRGSYHLYQGFGPFLGNAVMGVVFAEWFRRRGRVMPLIVAHTILDTVSFVGYQVFRSWLHLP
jgi:membrane protease YdiL (CAAX protease family)